MTPVVVSSETPRMFALTLENQPGVWAIRRLMTCRVSSSLVLRVGESEGSGLGARAEQNEQRGVAAIVEDHVGRLAVRPLEDPVGEIPVFGEVSPLCANTGNAARSDGRRRMVLRGKDVARGPAHFRPSATSVSIRTAVWIVIWSDPAMRAPFSGCDGPNSSRMATRPGISVSAMVISVRPQFARPMSFTAKSLDS
jgi:hypothetical protein